MTWRQALNLSEGHRKKVAREFDREKLLHRGVYTMIHNFLVKEGDRKEAHVLYPTEFDDQQEKENYSMPIANVKNLFYTIFADKVVKDE
jgi:hypothetical protein